MTKADDKILDEARKPTKGRVLSLLSYNEEAGEFRWLVTERNRLEGKLAGCLRHGYVFIGVDGTQYGAHRLAWLIRTGEWQPDGMQIDHINGVRSDNRIANLRLATPSQNNANWHRPGKGIRLHSCGKWEARLRVCGRALYLGLHDSAEEASAAYQGAAKLHFGEFAPS